MPETTPDPLPIINCHAHVFTVSDVPPRLAKSILPWPLHWVFQVTWMAGLVRVWTRSRNRIVRKRWYKHLCHFLYQVRIAMKRYFILRVLKIIFFVVVLASIFHDQYETWIEPFLAERNLDAAWLKNLHQRLNGSPFIITTSKWWVKLLLFCALLALFPVGRNTLLAILRQTNRFFAFLPGRQNVEMLKRYLNIVRFANYQDQSRVLSRLRQQYPPGTRHVLLPMDMTYMGAGTPSRSYHEQMSQLAVIYRNHSKEVFPFVFVDPRRMEKEGNSFFNYSVHDGKVVLDDCFIKDYIETKRFSGFKIYPALGYFPFEEKLLPLWKYAADNGIPIMTHCIRGVIYYRKRKQKQWDHHPVFEHFVGDDNDPQDGDYRQMLLPQMKPVDVQEIFTHPMNYVCLYKDELLSKLVANAKDNRVKQLFGYSDGKVTRGLGHLKLCFGHFGGEDEWKRFFESDRTNYGHQIIRSPDQGLDFLYTDGELKRGKPEQIWKTGDWYSIICSLMLQHPNVYADISYILHGDLEIMPLLRHTLQHPVLKHRVLYGSDFFVVRNYKSDKNMLADMRGALLEAEFNLIARENPARYLERTSE